jgi:hypothetical protein
VRHHWIFAACGCALLVAGCATTRHGTLRKLPSGSEIPVTVTVSETEATVKGTDPQSGEQFDGTLHVVKGEGDRGMLGPAPPVGGGAVTPGVAPPPVRTTKGTIHMTGRLEGSKGTSLRCTVDIERTLTMKGGGACVLADSGDPNPAYTLHF